MNTSNLLWEDSSFHELVEAVALYDDKSIQITSYPKLIKQLRPQLIQWLIFICQNSSFRKETLYLAIVLFDSYVSKSKSQSYLNDIQLTAIACLSLATKQEEINCNYTLFFTEKVLNENTSPNQYSIKDLTKCEMEILIELGFRTQITTPYHYSSIFLQACHMLLNNEKEFELLLLTNAQYLQAKVNDTRAIETSYVDIALSAIYDSLNTLFDITKAYRIMYIMNQLIRKGYTCGQFVKENLQSNIKEGQNHSKVIKA